MLAAAMQVGRRCKKEDEEHSQIRKRVHASTHVCSMSQQHLLLSVSLGLWSQMVTCGSHQGIIKQRYLGDTGVSASPWLSFWP